MKLTERRGVQVFAPGYRLKTDACVVVEGLFSPRRHEGLLFARSAEIPFGLGP